MSAELSPADKITPRSAFRGFLPFFWIALATITGIAAANTLELSVWAWLTGAVLALLSLILARRLPRSLVITHRIRRITGADQRLPGSILLFIFFIGAWRATALQPTISPEHVAYYNERGLIELTGRVIKPPATGDGALILTVAAESLCFTDPSTGQTQMMRVEGKVQIRTIASEEWTYGDQLRALGELQTPPEGEQFSFRELLARQGILSEMPHAGLERMGDGGGSALLRWVYRLRENAFQKLQTLFPSPEADLLSGILLGRDEGLPEEVQDAFKRTGTAHIIAISGFNIAILSGWFASSSAKFFGRKWGVLSAIAGITLYTILTGASASVVRAAIMGSLGVLGGVFGRRQNGLNSLGLAVSLMVFANPNIVFDIGFQLTGAATLGLIVYAQPLSAWVQQWLAQRFNPALAEKWISPISEFFLFTLAAQLLTLPLMAFHFGGISWVSLIVNPLILPVQSLVMILGGLALIGGLVSTGLGRLLSILALPPTAFTIRMVMGWASRVDGEWLIPEFHWTLLVLIYAILLGATLLTGAQRQTLLRKAVSPGFSLLILLALTISVWHQTLSAPDRRLHVTLLDSEGTVLIQTPNGNTALIGGGSRPSQLKQYLSQMLPGTDQQLNLLILSSTYPTDLTALPGTFDKFLPELVLWLGDPTINQTSRHVYALLAENEIPIQMIETGQSILIDENVMLNVVWTGERGAVFQLNLADFSAVIPAGKVPTAWLPADRQPPDVIILSDHNPSDQSVDPILTWQPAAVFLPLAENDLGFDGSHPLLTQLQDYPCASTAGHGWLRASTNGEQVWITTEN